MTHTFSKTAVTGIAILATFIALLPFVSHAISRTESRRDAAIFQHTGDGSSGGTGGTSGSGGVTAETDSSNTNESEGQAMLDELIATGGPNTEDLPVDPEVNEEEITEEVEEAVEDSGVEQSDYSFVSIIRSLFSRFSIK